MDRYNTAMRLLAWAQDHPWEWGIVCGFEQGNLEQNLDIAEMLRDEGFDELCLMMTVRAAGMCLDWDKRGDAEGRTF